MTNIKKFQAKAMVNLTVNLTKYKEIREYNKLKLAELREMDPNTKELPNHFFAKVIKCNSVLTFGDLEFDTETNQILVYPVEMFDKLSTTKVELSTSAFGLLDKDKMREGMQEGMTLPSDEAIEEVLRQEEAKHGFKPFILSPILVRV